MKVTLVSTWKPQVCGFAFLTPFLQEALSKYCEVEICVVNPNFTADQWIQATESCCGDIVHFLHEWGIFHNYADLMLDILREKNVPTVITAHINFQHFIGRANQVCVFNENYRGGYSQVVALPLGVTVYPKIEKEYARRLLGIEREKVVTQYGFVLPHKQYEITINAVRDRKDVCYIIAGTGQRDIGYWNRLEQITSSPMNCQIIKMGLLEESKVPLVFCATDLMTFPYNAGIDTSSLRFALANETLCLSSYMPFFQDLNRKYGVPVLTQDFSKAINHYLDHPEIEEYAEKCRWFAKDNSWDLVAQKHLAVYKNVLERTKK